MSVLLMFAPMIADIMNNRLQYGRDFMDRVALYSYVSIMSVYVIPVRNYFILNYLKIINTIKQMWN